MGASLAAVNPCYKDCWGEHPSEVSVADIEEAKEALKGSAEEEYVFTPEEETWKVIVNKGMGKVEKESKSSVINISDAVNIAEAGLQVDTKRHRFAYVVLCRISEGGALSKANEKLAANKKARIGDRVVAVNGREGSHRIVEELKSQHRLVLELARVKGMDDLSFRFRQDGLKSKGSKDKSGGRKESKDSGA